MKKRLSILFGCSKFHDFIYGRHCEIENDHKPLRQIFKKNISKSPPRIQRFLLALQRYDFTLNYIPGKHVIVADALSRAYLQDSTPEISETEMKAYIHTITQSFPMTDKKLNIYKQATAEDIVLQKLIGYTIHGWPNHKKDIDPKIMPYHTIRDSITYVDGLLIKGAKQIIAPSILHEEARKHIHTGHLGIVKCLLRMKESVYWLKLTQL